MADRIAVLGTGKMGSAIASALSAVGREVVVWNRTRSRAEALGFGTVADTPAAAVRDADVVISSLTGPEAVLATYLGPDAALSAGSGKRFIEMSTAGPDLVAELLPHIAAAGATLVDAPILGAPPLVRAGQATILAGGTDKDVSAVQPVLNVFGTVRHVGSSGSAARLKLIANSMLADVIAAAAELQVAGEAMDLDPEDVFWVLTRVAPTLEPRRAGFVEDRHTPSMFALRDLRKDLHLALELIATSPARTPLTVRASDQIDAVAAETPDLDISAVVRPYREALSRRPVQGSVGRSRRFV